MMLLVYQRMRSRRCISLNIYIGKRFKLNLQILTISTLCHILYIDPFERKYLSSILSASKVGVVLKRFKQKFSSFNNFQCRHLISLIRFVGLKIQHAGRLTDTLTFYQEDMNIMSVVCLYNLIKYFISSLPLLQGHTAIVKHALLLQFLLYVHNQMLSRS